MRLWLVVRDKDVVREAGLLASSDALIDAIVPKREPDKKYSDGKAWNVQGHERHMFAGFVVKKMETASQSVEEELFGFFSLVGLGRRWVDSAFDWEVRLCPDEVVFGNS